MKKSPTLVLTFPNINPISTAEEAIEQGHYNDYYRFISNETVKIEPAEGLKNLHLVCFDRNVGETKYMELLRAEGKHSCRNAPAYLAGLMTAMPEDTMPKKLRNKDLVAAEPDNPSSAFADEGGRRCFLYVHRSGAHRWLSLIRVDGWWPDGWAFLAEDLVP